MLNQPEIEYSNEEKEHGSIFLFYVANLNESSGLLKEEVFKDQGTLLSDCEKWMPFKTENFVT